MKLTKNHVEEYICSEIYPKFPVIFRKIHIASIVTTKENKFDIQPALRTIKLPKYGNIVKYQNRLYKPICNED